MLRPAADPQGPNWTGQLPLAMRGSTFSEASNPAIMQVWHNGGSFGRDGSPTRPSHRSLPDMARLRELAVTMGPISGVCEH